MSETALQTKTQAHQSKVFPMAGESLTMSNHSESHAWWQGLDTEPTNGARYWQMGLACSLLLLLMVV